ncbi:MAG: hypothetical protein OXC38_03445 [Gammaproteobacteria bacterium]|nr:hypothetical protein [Gammaproteobacteria bacterium]
MPPRPPVPKRKRFFIGAEGESEKSFARWLERLRNHPNPIVHLDITVCDGGDSLAIANHAVAQYRKRTDAHGKFAAGLILLDSDRIKQDRSNNRDPEIALKGQRGIRLVYLTPNLEGLLLRLHAGHEQEFVAADKTLRALRKQWPEYKKPASADVLDTRFDLSDLQRAARHDDELREVLKTLGLPLR